MNRVAFACVAFVAAASAGAASAQNPDVGEVLYREYCSACHGDSARGHGVVAQFLTVEPPNLREIGQRNGGEFPLLRVIQTIDGRSQVGPHGGPMPLWGAQFSEYLEERIGTYAAVIETRGRIMSLALYLESIQE